MKNNQENPYQFIHLNSEVKYSTNPNGSLTITQETRSLDAIERSMINDTEEFISILDGSTTKSNHLLDGERSTDKPFDAVVYLDKSARPVRKIVHGIMEGAEPQAFFMNIDKRPYLAEMGFFDGHNGTNLEDINPEEVSIEKMDPAYLRHLLTRIRSLFVDHTELLSIKEEEDTATAEADKDIERVWSMPTRLDGQTVAILDEVKSSGNTLRIAKQLLEAAIPDANFEGMWWSDPGQVSWDTNEERRQRAAKYVPAWYDSTSSDGRGVGEINERLSSMSKSKAQRIGRQILSAPLLDTETGKVIGLGKRTKMINEDIKTLVQRYKDGELINYHPDFSTLEELGREEDGEARLMAYYKVATPAEAYAILREKNSNR